MVYIHIRFKYFINGDRFSSKELTQTINEHCSYYNIYGVFSKDLRQGKPKPVRNITFIIQEEEEEREFEVKVKGFPKGDKYTKMKKNSDDKANMIPVFKHKGDSNESINAKLNIGEGNINLKDYVRFILLSEETKKVVDKWGNKIKQSTSSNYNGQQRIDNQRQQPLCQTVNNNININNSCWSQFTLNDSNYNSNISSSASNSDTTSRKILHYIQYVAAVVDSDDMDPLNKKKRDHSHTKTNFNILNPKLYFQYYYPGFGTKRKQKGKRFWFKCDDTIFELFDLDDGEISLTIFTIADESYNHFGVLGTFLERRGLFHGRNKQSNDVSKQVFLSHEKRNSGVPTKIEARTKREEWSNWGKWTSVETHDVLPENKELSDYYELDNLQ
ncbi:hypothetical protein ABK040_005086 [Willaertia magna]